MIRDNWYEAIFLRHSRRSYLQRDLKPAHLASLIEVFEDINQANPNIRIACYQGQGDTIFRGIVGSYGKITGAPALAAFIGCAANPHVLEDIGYFGECVVLHATSLGVGTCWVAGTVDRGMLQARVELTAEEKIYAVTPLGYPTDNLGAGERLVKLLARSHRRKGLEAICPDLAQKDLPRWFRSGLEAARVAPSAMNKQPWLFSFQDGVAVVSAANGSEGSRLDCGIAMLHFELGALYTGVRGYWEYAQFPQIAKFTVES